MWGQLKLRAALAAEVFPAAFAAAPVLAQYTSLGVLNVNWLTGANGAGVNGTSFLASLSAGGMAGGEERGVTASVELRMSYSSF